ncbi:tryptophan halogenase family protein [Sphingomonas sp. S2-65]|uniref:tryptophan halogenase family protein n=1 Tax=Sphingomonas sp. S2-65 TaxID=2903960 RepID=UPI001F4041F6|nr:tryptophan halogenase family protein [Sphingomonas sp. S2-65]UYY57868.1 tryptophan 7-halogenase [Sphingomonas sp. S2-65]
MSGKRGIVIVGGGTAGWLAAAYLARVFDGRVAVTLLESSEIGIIGVGEGAFPTIRSTLQFLGIDESRFIRAASATFKQGIRFDDWLHAATPEGERHRYLHPFEAPFYTEGTSLVPYWLLQDHATRPPFADAMTIQNRVAEAQRAPKRPGEGDYAGPLNYAYHFDAARLAEVLRARAVELGVRHLEGKLTRVDQAEDGSIARVHTAEHGALEGDLYLDCSGFRAELIGKTLGTRLKSVKHQLFTERALACKLPYGSPDAPIESFTVATAHPAGWTWDIGLQGARGIGCVYSSAHMDDAEAAEILRGYIGHDDYSARIIPFEPGYRETQWVKNCVAVGLAGGFLEPLESTGIVLIEAAVAMIADFYPHHGRADASARRFNQLMTARYETIINFLKLHYCLSRRDEPFWRDNRNTASIPEALQALLEAWRHRPPSRFDFLVDLESFAFFNYQYILYGMDFRTDLSGARADFPDMAGAEKLFARIRSFGARATEDLPTHRALIRQINEGASLGA